MFPNPFRFSKSLEFKTWRNTSLPPIPNFQFATLDKTIEIDPPWEGGRERSRNDWLALSMGGSRLFRSERWHRPNSGTLSYLLRGRVRVVPVLLALYIGCSPRSCTTTPGVVSMGTSVDDGMTDRGRVRVADTGRVIGRPPGADHPRGATRVDLLARHNGLSN